MMVHCAGYARQRFSAKSFSRKTEWTLKLASCHGHKNARTHHTMLSERDAQISPLVQDSVAYNTKVRRFCPLVESFAWVWQLLRNSIDAHHSPQSHGLTLWRGIGHSWPRVLPGLCILSSLHAADHYAGLWPEDPVWCCHFETACTEVLHERARILEQRVG